MYKDNIKKKKKDSAKPCPTLMIPAKASPSMGFSRQEHGSGLPFPSPEERPNPGIEPRSPALHIYVLKHLSKFNNQNTHHFNVIFVKESRLMLKASTMNKIPTF